MEFALKSYGRTEEEKKADQALEQKWMEQYNFNQWYDVLGNETFESIMMDITEKEAASLALLYKINQQKHKIDEKQEEELNDTIKQFKIRINKILKQNTCLQHENGYFVRLSSRSPKDAVMEPPFVTKTKQLMYNDLKHKMRYNYKDNLNAKTISYLQSCMNCLKVSDCDEMITLLTNSLRVYEDINLFQCKGLKLIIRRWNDMMLGSEYRGFVGKNAQLNALCQYYSFLYFEHVKENKDYIKNAIVKYYNDNIKHKLSAKDLFPCVIDFVIMNQFEFIDEINTTANIKVIELNIFHDYSDKVMIQSGAEMFDWDKDRNVLLNGPFEFRILDSLPTDEYIEQYIGPDWNNINDVAKKLKQHNTKANNCYIL